MRVLLICLILIACGGCSALKSRYAMDDPVYADKYAEGAAKFDLLGKAKQALDARHAKGLGGTYLSGGAQYQASASDPFAGIEWGVESYPNSWTTGRVSLAATVGDNEGRIGVDLGARVQTPTRIAPFAGVGMFFGTRPHHTDPAEMDGIDNDDDGLIDEFGEYEWDFDNWLVSIYPEVGAHVWLNGSWRLTAYARYLFTTEGRGHDDWLLGGQLTVFHR